MMTHSKQRDIAVVLTLISFLLFYSWNLFVLGYVIAGSLFLQFSAFFCLILGIIDTAIFMTVFASGYKKFVGSDWLLLRQIEEKIYFLTQGLLLIIIKSAFLVFLVKYSINTHVSILNILYYSVPLILIQFLFLPPCAFRLTQKFVK